MADSHVIQGSSTAKRRISQSANLAEILSSTASETQVDDNRSTDECVTGFVNDLISILQSKSSEAVIRHLVAKYASNLVGLRDKVLQVVQSKWSSCPKRKNNEIWWNDGFRKASTGYCIARKVLRVRRS